MTATTTGVLLIWALRMPIAKTVKLSQLLNQAVGEMCQLIAWSSLVLMMNRQSFPGIILLLIVIYFMVGCEQRTILTMI